MAKTVTDCRGSSTVVNSPKKTFGPPPSPTEDLSTVVRSSDVYFFATQLSARYLAPRGTVCRACWLDFIFFAVGGVGYGTDSRPYTIQIPRLRTRGWYLCPEHASHFGVMCRVRRTLASQELWARTCTYLTNGNNSERWESWETHNTARKMYQHHKRN